MMATSISILGGGGAGSSSGSEEKKIDEVVIVVDFVVVVVDVLVSVFVFPKICVNSKRQERPKLALGRLWEGHCTAMKTMSLH